MKIYLGKIISLFFLVAFIIYFLNDPSKFEPLKQVPLTSLIIIALLKITTTFVNGLFIKIILKAFNKYISQLETFYIAIISSIGNHFLPMQGGASIRAVYLKKKHKLSYANFLSTLSGNYIISFLINSLLGLISLLYIHYKFNLYSPILYFFFAGLFTCTLVLSIFGVPEFIFKIKVKFDPLNNILEILHNIVIGWARIIKDKRLLISLIKITIINFFISVLVLYIEFKALNLAPNLTKLTLYSTISSMSLLIGVTPGSIGIKETILIFSATVIGITNEQVLQIAVIDRGIAFFDLFVMYISIKLFNNKHNPIKEYQHE